MNYINLNYFNIFIITYFIGVLAVAFKLHREIFHIKSASHHKKVITFILLSPFTLLSWFYFAKKRIDVSHKIKGGKSNE